MRAVSWLGALAALATLSLGACFNPTIPDGAYQCGANDACPPGYSCSCGLCTQGSTPTACPDMTPSVDLWVDPVGCANGHKRSPEDPGLLKIAFCPAAWAVAGVAQAATTQTPCNRAPGSNGLSGTTPCTVEDNCSIGWHVCRSEADLAINGLSMSKCSAAVKSADGIWVSRQPGMSSTSGYSCVLKGTAGVFGCGNAIGAAAESCAVEQTVLTEQACIGSACSPWDVGTVSTMPDEGQQVVKTSTTRGGVLCCKDR